MNKRFALFGVQVDALSISDLNTLIAAVVARGERGRIIANHNLHSVYLYHHEPMMRAFYSRSDWTHIDGMPIIFLGRLLGLPLKRQHRVTYVDWIDSLMAEAAARGWRIFYLGSKPGIAERGACVLARKFPGLQIATAHGYFNQQRGSAEDRTIMRRIAEFQPNILMLGMGMPRQEIWALEHVDEISANVTLSAGAAMDYVAGAVPSPPRWAGRIGLEWLFRLVAEPKRLWRRYLLEPWFLLTLMFRTSFKTARLEEPLHDTGQYRLCRAVEVPSLAHGVTAFAQVEGASQEVGAAEDVSCP